MILGSLGLSSNLKNDPSTYRTARSVLQPIQNLVYKVFGSDGQVLTSIRRAQICA